MYGTIEVFPLEKVIGYEDLYVDAEEVSCLKAGVISRICFRIYEDFSFITYDIDGAFKKYINVEDGLSTSSLDREMLSFHTTYEVKDSVTIEIAGLKRDATINSIEINWTHNECNVCYGIKDLTETVYYGIPEKRLKMWNRDRG